MDHQPRSGVRTKKKRRDGLIRLAKTHPDWTLGFGDEVWWSRVSQPRLSSWADDDQPLRVVEQTVRRRDPDPKALACYGLLVRHWDAAGKRDEQLWLRFVDGRPVSGITTQFLAWCCERLTVQGKTALLLVWDNVSWHVSKTVRVWIGRHNRAVKEAEDRHDAYQGSATTDGERARVISGSGRCVPTVASTARRNSAGA